MPSFDIDELGDDFQYSDKLHIMHRDGQGLLFIKWIHLYRNSQDAQEHSSHAAHVGFLNHADEPTCDCNVRKVDCPASCTEDVHVVLG